MKLLCHSSGWQCSWLCLGVCWVFSMLQSFVERLLLCEAVAKSRKRNREVLRSDAKVLTHSMAVGHILENLVRIGNLNSDCCEISTPIPKTLDRGICNQFSCEIHSTTELAQIVHQVNYCTECNNLSSMHLAGCCTIASIPAAEHRQLFQMCGESGQSVHIIRSTPSGIIWSYDST